MRKSGFEGWYFKHQNGDNMVALIPGAADSGAFIQVVTPGDARQLPLPSLRKDGGCIRAEGLCFTREGCTIDLPGVSGEVRYGSFHPLQSPIMGPFRFFPMECSHEVISMAHALSGSLTVDGQCISLDGGVGYIEKDSGTSFPASYQWMQCSFPACCSVMVSIAEVPFSGVRFRGCICAILHGGREYRLATYRGVRILAADARHICLSQGRLLLEIDMEPMSSGHRLLAPIGGRMCGTIRESSNAAVRVRLFESGRPVLDLRSSHAAYEFVPSVTRLP